ncbi:CaiB/BaiF CoA transferase family protein [Oceanomicrobium pacificus]|uniref:CoA transferase n=1 Tax=Oceanomicrobium pacificus TaxID=2692916 RepID=A0A6B0TZE2_9RHOB|nr:CoA transferase [Oceanomicrobium pacificus]MXU66778.1 CoA transferase [Oceanomicrobium pacificus]
MQAPLNGIRVLELARVLAGPWIGQTLADLGADVIKVEAPGGDETRGWGPPFAEDGTAAYYHSCNRNKRSIALDFCDPDDLALVRDLARSADVLIENFKVGGLAKFGLDYATLSAETPGLVYCSVTGFGQDGPDAGRAGYDFIIQAMSGIMDITGEPDGPPTKPGVAYADIFTGLYGTIAVQAALRARDATGRGTHIDMALMDAQMGVLANQAANYFVSGRSPKRLGNSHPNIVPYQTFEAADGPFVIACGNDGQFARLSREMGKDWAADPRFARNADRVTHRAELVALIAAEVASLSRDALMALLDRAGVPGSPIRTIAEAFDTEQARHRGMAVPRPDDAPEGAPATMVRNPIRFSAHDLARPQPAPMLDADGPEIRAALRRRAGEKDAAPGWPERPTRSGR